jgi:hypothetical protein
MRPCPKMGALAALIYSLESGLDTKRRFPGPKGREPEEGPN